MLNFDFSILKKLWDLAHEKLMNIIGSMAFWMNIHGCQTHPKVAIYYIYVLSKTAQKW